MEKRRSASAGTGDGTDTDDVCHVVNTASLAGISEACGLYGVTKHGVVAATEAVSSELAWRDSNVRVSVLCPSYVASNVAKTTIRSELNASPAPPAHGGESDERTPEGEDLDDLQDLFARLPALIANGMSPHDVASATFDGIREGRRYIYTDHDHTLAAIEDRVDQLRAGGLPAESFKRRMEWVVDSELSKAAWRARELCLSSIEVSALGPRRHFCARLLLHPLHPFGLQPDPFPLLSVPNEPENYYRPQPADDPVHRVPSRKRSPDRISFASSTINNHASLESGFYGWQAPDAVAFAKSTEEVSAVLRICNEHRVPVVAYGTGTPVEGHIDCTRPSARSVRDGRNNFCTRLTWTLLSKPVTRETLNEDFATQVSSFCRSRCQRVDRRNGRNQCAGTTTLRHGNMASNVLGLTAVLSNGDIVRTGGRSRKFGRIRSHAPSDRF